jgi:hypothetical protein
MIPLCESNSVLFVSVIILKVRSNVILIVMTSNNGRKPEDIHYETVTNGIRAS